MPMYDAFIENCDNISFTNAVIFTKNNLGRGFYSVFDDVNSVFVHNIN